MWRIVTLAVACLVVSTGCESHQTKHDASPNGLEAAERDVTALKMTLKEKSPEELIGVFIPAPDVRMYGGCDYYYPNIANIAIQDELEARGPAIVATLRKHVNDSTRICDFINGPGKWVGSVCKHLLDNIANDAPRDGLEAAERDAAAFKTTLKQKSPEELVKLIIPFSSNGTMLIGGYDYYYNKLANDAVREEIAARGAAAGEVLKAHVGDSTLIWESVNGPGDTVGRICKELLNHIEYEEEKSLPDPFR